jgi:hypothetical protein
MERQELLHIPLENNSNDELSKPTSDRHLQHLLKRPGRTRSRPLRPEERGTEGPQQIKDPRLRVYRAACSDEGCARRKYR